jgi:hypothetical protein
MEGLFRARRGNARGQVAGIDRLQRDEPASGRALLRRLFLVHVGQIAIQGHQQEGPEAPFGPIGLLDQLPLEHDLMEEPLCQVLGLLVVTPFAANIAVDRFPVTVHQQADQGAVPGLGARTDPVDERPVRG